jgi:sugar phosphate isomerase/epimerase
MGFQGVEIRAVQGELHLPLVPELAGNPERTRAMFSSKQVELVSLACSATLDSRKRRVLAEKKALLTEFVELANRLGCPFVRIQAGEIQSWDNQRIALGRIAETLRTMIPVLSGNNVALLVENGGDFPGSADLWFLVDAVNHPSVLACWNQCYARTAGERATNSLPRLGANLGLVHVADAAYDDQGVLLQYTPLGAGQTEVSRQVEILKGLAYNGYLMLDWPKMWDASLPDPESALPAAGQYLRDLVSTKQAVLSAYKGDKYAPKFVSRSPSGQVPAT